MIIKRKRSCELTTAWTTYDFLLLSGEKWILFVNGSKKYFYLKIIWNKDLRRRDSYLASEK